MCANVGNTSCVCCKYFFFNCVCQLSLNLTLNYIDSYIVHYQRVNSSSIFGGCPLLVTPMYLVLTSKTQIPGLSPEFLIQQGGEGPGICLSNPCPGAADAGF